MDLQQGDGQMGGYGTRTHKWTHKHIANGNWQLAAVMLAIVVGLSGCLGGCGSSLDGNADNAGSADNSSKDISVLVGCYTVSVDEPAQIKLSLNEGQLLMQMKEPAHAAQLWDAPEPLLPLATDQIGNYFNIDASQVTAVVARPDKMLVMAHVQPSYANVDPLMDSEYLAYIYKGANTIYKVACDEQPLDLLDNPHGKINQSPN